MAEEYIYEFEDKVRRLHNKYHECVADMSRVYIESLEAELESRLGLESLNEDDNETPQENEPENIRRINWKSIIAVLVLLCATYNFRSIYSCLVCNLQDYVYPGLRLLRSISIPFVSLFPSLTAWYHESCFIQNPFFTIVDMDCWPCSTVTNILEIHDPEPVHQQHSAPFVYETNQKVINLATLKDLYVKHKNIFDKESSKILVNNKNSIQPDEMFHMANGKGDNSFYVWRFNNMNVARVLRQIISRPKVVPKFGQSTERFLIIDSSQKSIAVPDTECNYSFLQSLSGKRIVHLIPAEECKTQCKSLKVDLKESYLLWYNWWYWRPMIQPTNENATLIAHVGSYC